MFQCFRRRVSEQYIGSLDGSIVIFLGMNHDRHFLCQTFLQRTEMRCFFLFFDQGINFFLGQIGKDLDIFGSIGIAHVQPELVEFIRRCITAIQPNVARLSFAELASVGFRNQRAGQSKSLTTQLTADQLRTGRDVTPLVGSSHLQAAAFVFIQIHIIVSLKQLVREFRKRHTDRRFAAQAFFNGFFSHHIVNSDMLTDIADKIQERIILHPVVIVYQLGSIRRVRIEIQKLGQLLLNAILVMTKRRFIEQVTFRRLH